MSSDFSVRPPGAPSATDFSRSPPLTARGAVPSQVTAANSVTAAGGGQTSANDTPDRHHSAALNAALGRAVAELVYRAAGSTIDRDLQTAEDLTEKMRAYRRAQQSNRSKREQTSDQNTDREA